jgi:hypothetical protein
VPGIIPVFVGGIIMPVVRGGGALPATGIEAVTPLPLPPPVMPAPLSPFMALPSLPRLVPHATHASTLATKGNDNPKPLASRLFVSIVICLLHH